MERETDREFTRVNKRIDSLEEKHDKHESKLSQLGRDIMRFWHLGIGIGLGLILKEVGLEKLLSKFL